jgi:hypothetical protein
MQTYVDGAPITSNYNWNVYKLEESMLKMHNCEFFSNIVSTHCFQSKLENEYVSKLGKHL